VSFNALAHPAHCRRRPHSLGRTNVRATRIRRETPADVADIARLSDAAFTGMPYAQGDEAELVTKLRRLGSLTVSRVAEEHGRVVGHIALSPARSRDGAPGWCALGPIAVLTERQGAGMGSALVAACLDERSILEARGCVRIGHPGLCRRAGFDQAPENAPTGHPAAFFMCKLLSGDAPRGPIQFHEAFTRAT
jgi:predicted N-acetyltransferase YhbS